MSRRAKFRIAAALAIAGVAATGLFVGCMTVPGPSSGSEAIAALPRSSVLLPSGRTVGYLSAGDPEGRRIVYVHGTPGDATGWADYLVDPVPGTESIAIDRPGFGRSAPGGAMSSLAQQAAALEPFLVERGGKWPILVGHSLGGPIVARAAADFPDRVGGIVIAAGSLDPGMEKVLAVQRVGEWRAVSWIVPGALRTANRELIPLRDELEALEPLLAQIRCPVVIVHGTEDGLVPFGNVAYMRRHIPAESIVEVMVLEGGNHFLPWNSAPAMRSAVEALMRLPAQE